MFTCITWINNKWGVFFIFTATSPFFSSTPMPIPSFLRKKITYFSVPRNVPSISVQYQTYCREQTWRIYGKVPSGWLNRTILFSQMGNISVKRCMSCYPPEILIATFILSCCNFFIYTQPVNSKFTIRILSIAF